MKQLQPLRPQLGVQRAYTSQIAAGSVEAGNQALLDWIAADIEDDRDRGGRGLCRARSGAPPRVTMSSPDREPDQSPIPAVDRIGSPPREIRSPHFGLRYNRLHLNLDETPQRCTSPPGELQLSTPITGIPACCARAQRPRHSRAAEQADELPPPHAGHGLPPRCRRRSYQLEPPGAGGLTHQEPAGGKVSRSLGQT